MTSSTLNRLPSAHQLTPALTEESPGPPLLPAPDMAQGVEWAFGISIRAASFSQAERTRSAATPGP